MNNVGKGTGNLAEKAVSAAKNGRMKELYDITMVQVGGGEDSQ